VRELRNAVERCVVLSVKGSIDVGDLPGEFASGLEPPATAGSDFQHLTYDDARAAFERNYLLQVIEGHGGNISQAASAIGRHRQTLQYKLKQLGIRRAWSE
jgi:DNA-binding NtrC family response regulator